MHRAGESDGTIILVESSVTTSGHLRGDRGRTQAGWGILVPPTTEQDVCIAVSDTEIMKPLFTFGLIEEGVTFRGTPLSGLDPNSDGQRCWNLIVLRRSGDRRPLFTTNEVRPVATVGSNIDGKIER